MEMLFKVDLDELMSRAFHWTNVSILVSKDSIVEATVSTYSELKNTHDI